MKWSVNHIVTIEHIEFHNRINVFSIEVYCVYVVKIYWQSVMQFFFNIVTNKNKLKSFLNCKRTINFC
jgi:hypothetical protein